MKQIIQTQKIEITTWTILKAVFLLVGLSLAWQLRGVMFMLFFAFILYSAFNPVVSYFEKMAVPRWLSILCIYLILFVVISIIMVVSTNVLIDQFENLSTDFEAIMSSFLSTVTDAFPWLQDEINPDQAASEILNNSFLNSGLVSSNTLSNAFGVLTSVSSIALGVFVVMVVSVYMLDGKEKFYTRLVDYLPKKKQKKIMDLMKRIESGLGSWFLGQLFLMLVVGFVTWVVIALPGLFFESYTLDQYALAIALIAGLLEAVPNIGPVVTVGIAMIIAVGSGNLTTGDTSVVIIAQTLYVMGAGILIQNLEAVFLVPAVMKKVVGVDPIVTIMGIISALSLFGIVGALLVIPVVATGQIIFEFYREEQREKLV